MTRCLFLFAIIGTMLFATVVPDARAGGDGSMNLYAGGLNMGGAGGASGSTEFLFGARYGFNMDANSTIEANIGLLFPEHQKVLMYHVNYLYNIALSGNEQITPFVTGGVGAITSIVDDQDIEIGGQTQTIKGETTTKFAFNVGGGVKYAASGPWGIRVDVRDHLVSVDVVTVDTGTGQQSEDSEMTNNIEFTGGVTYAFY